MDSRSGEILREEMIRELEPKKQRRFFPINDRQHKDLLPMGADQRKGYMRNQPCVCGSGQKFKRCCWSKYE